VLKEWIAVKIDRVIGARCRGDYDLGFFFPFLFSVIERPNIYYLLSVEAVQCLPEVVVYVSLFSRVLVG
jgi:hypothetical protein